MTMIKQWMTDLALLPNFDVNRLQPCQITYTQHIFSYTELMAYLAKIGVLTGWLQESSCVQSLQNQVITTSTHPIMGEFYQENTHWCLEYVGAQKWQMHEFVHQACDAENATYLAEAVYHNFVHSPDRQQLKYLRLWEKTSEVNLAPVARLAVFAGFVESK